MTKQQLLQQMEEKIKEECTFQPKINENSLKIQYQQLSQEQRLKRLATPKSQQYIMREKKKIKEELKNIKEQCTFAPVINKNSSQISQNKTQSLENVTDRLSHEADMKWQQRERLKRQMEEKELSQYNFTPQINNNLINTIGNRPPIYMRIDQMQREKQDNVNKVRLQQEQRESLTFKPVISPTSCKIAQQKFQIEKKENLDVVQRLLIDAQQKLEKSQQINLNQDSSCTFKPELISLKLSKEEDKDFYQRQIEFQEQNKLRKQQIALKTQEDVCTFVPNIDHNSRYIADSIKKNESGNKYEKLSIMDSSKRKDKIKKIEEQYYQQFTFEPKINKISKFIGRSTSLENLANNEEIQQSKKKIQQEQIMKQNESCTFKPQTTKMSKNAESRYNDPVSILNNIDKDKKKIEEKRQQIKKNMEYEEIKDCTFKPTVCGTVKNAAQPVIVKGLGRHLDLKEQAKKKVEEKMQREEKAFVQYAKYQRDLPYTVPSPFNLSLPNKERKIKQQQQFFEEQMKECTFQPRLNRQIFTQRSQIPTYGFFNFKFRILINMNFYLKCFKHNQTLASNLKISRTQSFVSFI